MGAASHAARVPGAAQREAKRNGALQTRDRYKLRAWNGPASAVHRHSASKTRVNALMALHRVRDTRTERTENTTLRRTAPNRHSGAIRLPIFRNFDAADAVEEIGGDVARHLLGERSKRPVVVGASHRDAEGPEVNRRTAPGANDGVELCLVDRAPAERRNLAGEGHLDLAGSIIAEERDGNIADLKSGITGVSSPAPDELLSFLHRFLQGPGDRRDFKDG